MRAYVLDGGYMRLYYLFVPELAVDTLSLPSVPQEMEAERVSEFAAHTVPAQHTAVPATPFVPCDATPSPPRAPKKRRVEDFQDVDSPLHPVRPRKRARVDDEETREQSPMTPARPTSEGRGAGRPRDSEDSTFSLDSVLGFGTPSEASPADKEVVRRPKSVDLSKLARRAGRASGRLARTVFSPFRFASSKPESGDRNDLRAPRCSSPVSLDQREYSQRSPEAAMATPPPASIASNPATPERLGLHLVASAQTSPQTDSSRFDDVQSTAPAPAWTSPVQTRAVSRFPRDVEGVLAALEDVSIRDVCAHEHGKMHRGSMLTLGMRAGVRL
ncbi:unnamed protein product [Peniophora sp. CBMAI 1063]|nr:unnamed protein product [Peniophora sp. CBMAI 1063]